MLVVKASVRLSYTFLFLLILGCSAVKKELPREAAPTEAAPAGTQSAEAAPAGTESVEAAPAGTESASGGGEPEAAAPAAGTEPGAAAGADEALTRAAPLAAVLLPEEVRPGEPFAVAFSTDGSRAAGGIPANCRAALINSRGQRLAAAAFFNLDGDGTLAALLAVPSTAVPGTALVRLEQNGTILGEIALSIAEREFASEEIALDQRNTDIRTAPDPQKTFESEELSAIIYAAGTELFATGPFVPPVDSTRRTSFYGDRRVFRYVSGESDAAIHAGVDYGIPTGTEVRSCAAGKVVLARFRIATGNSVVLEHLPGVYSLYYHLDSIQVSQGDRVNAGEPLGKSGSTGLATGPHLHWEIRVAGENADPDAFIARAVLDKAAILSKLGK